jgi:Mor family transcriptional regulator
MYNIDSNQLRNKTMEYWDNPEVFEKRNEEIIKDKLSGKMTVLEISKKYNISGTRILKIVQRYKNSRNLKETK